MNQLVDDAIRSRVRVQQIKVDLLSQILDDPRKIELESALTVANLESDRAIFLLRHQLLHGDVAADAETS